MGWEYPAGAGRAPRMPWILPTGREYPRTYGANLATSSVIASIVGIPPYLRGEL